MKSLMVSVLLSVFAVNVFAGPNVSLAVKAEVEVEQVVAGVKKTVRIEADDVSPGQEVIYTLMYTNTGDEAANNVELKNPITQNFHYVDNSVWGQGTQIQFSVDGGKTFAVAEQLSVNKSGKIYKAAANDYTHVLWKVASIKAGENGHVGFKAKLN